MSDALEFKEDDFYPQELTEVGVVKPDVTCLSRSRPVSGREIESESDDRDKDTEEPGFESTQNCIERIVNAT